MKVKNIDLEHIAEILKAIPDGVEVDSIQFLKSDVRIVFSAGDEVIKNIEYERSLQHMNEVLNDISQNKNYLLKDKDRR